MSAIALAIFMFGSLTLWVTAFGYVIVLILLAPHRPSNVGRRELQRLPEIAIVVPTLNEASFIAEKLNNLRDSAYPHDRMTITVVDGGSTDRTKSLVRAAMADDASVQLICHDGARNQADQVNLALRLITQEIVVVTDADAWLEPACIRELVTVLLEDLECAAVGAQIEPDTTLLDERLHWRLVNYIWGLEGEALSCASVSGVCYAVRRRAIEQLHTDSDANGAKDILLSLGLCASGFRVRTCRSAHATERRVPQTLKEFLDFRRRRGVAYSSAIQWSLQHRGSKGIRGLASAIRWWHFIVTPRLTLALAALGFLLLWTHYAFWSIIICSIFGLSLMMAGLFILLSSPDGWHQPWRRMFALVRSLGLNLYAMMTLDHNAAAQPPKDAG